MRYIGKEIEKVDALEKASGTALYQGDIKIPCMLYGKAVRTRYPHARIVSIDVTAAKAVNGVIDVLTAEHIPGENLFGKAVADQPVFCTDKVRFLGDAIALVIAETEEIANYAKELVEVRYEILEPITSIEMALRPESEKIHPDGNIAAFTPIKKGDIEKGFAESDFIIERTYTTQFVEHSCMDTEASAAYYDDEGGFDSSEFIAKCVFR